MKKIPKKVLIPIAIIGILVLVFVFKSKAKVPDFSSTKVERVNLVQSVEETGTIAAGNDVSYGFEINGKVVAVSKKIGDMVSSTDIIANLNSTTQQSSLAQAEAGLAQAKAALNLSLAGKSTEARLESQARVNQTKASLEQAKIKLSQVKIQNNTKITTAENDLANALNDLRLAENTDTSILVSNATTNLFNSLQATIPTISDGLRESDNILGIDNTIANDNFEAILGSLNDNTLIQAKSNYTVAKQSFVSAQQVLAGVTDSKDKTSVTNISITVITTLNKTHTLLLSIKALLDATVRGAGLTQTELDTMKSNTATAQTNINTKITDITTKSQAIDEAENSVQKKQLAYQKAETNLAQTKDQAKVDEAIAEASLSIEMSALAQVEAAHSALIAPPREVDTASLRAEINRQSATLFSAIQEVEKTKLRAITNGIIAKLDLKVGQTVSANNNIVTIISTDRTVEVDISETDIAKISLGDPVEITLDAFGEDKIFKGLVRTIEPAETEISGVIYYNTDITLLSEDGVDIRPGMTANIKIITDTKENTLVIPQRAIFKKDNKQIVRLLNDKTKGTFTEIEIELGIRGDDGLVEIISGLTKDQEIITFLKEK